MNEKATAHRIISTLERGGFHAKCPCCDGDILLRGCGLFYFDDFSPRAQELYEQQWIELKERNERLQRRRKRISQSSEVIARATNVGSLLERLAPSLSNFNFACSDCRSLFDPIDYVIFKGLCNGGRVSQIIFADIKTGNSRLNSRQNEIRDLVRAKKVDFEVYEPNE